MIIPSWVERAPADRDCCYQCHCSMAMLVVLAVSTTDEDTLLLEGQFRRYYRMDACSFERLLSFIGPALVRDELQSRRRSDTDPLSPENMLQMTIPWLVGSKYHTTRCLGGTAVPTIYAVMHQLQIHAPTESQEHIFDLADGFADINKHTIVLASMMVGCMKLW
ncbi:hypothetical protein PHMEG_00029746 [Phytophthora megakarya]|uniref:Uncharacterized protein n=1 Tax=Phytophthora megakarya TaxID=4795 RepID=A0A225V2T9_9STRA|nr:hypothetical protein PHMEG_00029746 [Phytophthora megakarya]